MDLMEVLRMNVLMRAITFIIILALTPSVRAEFIPDKQGMVPLSNEEAAKKLNFYGGPPCEETRTVNGKAERSVYQLACLLKHVRREIKNVGNFDEINGALRAGSAVVSMVINGDGTCSDVKIIESTFSDARIDESIAEIVRNYKFKSQNVPAVSFGAEITFK